MDTLGTDPKFLPKGGSAPRSPKRSVSVAALLALGDKLWFWQGGILFFIFAFL